VISGAAVDVPVNPAVAAARMEIRNTTAVDDALVAVASPDGSASIHRSEVDPEGRAVMVAVDRLAVPARSTLVFEPGGLHVMLNGIERDLGVGAVVVFELTFERAGTVTVEVPVVEPGGSDAAGHEHGAVPSESGRQWR
jgi:copper(I)-binding protein